MEPSPPWEPPTPTPPWAPPAPPQPWAPIAPSQPWGQAPPPPPPQWGQPAWGPPPAPTFPPPRTSSKGGRVVALVIVALVLLIAVGGVAAALLMGSDDSTAVATLQERWGPVTSRSGRYTLDMPPNPTFADLPVPVSSGPELSVAAIYCGDGTLRTANVGLMFLETDLSPTGGTPEQFAGAFDDELDGMARGSIESLDGTVTNTIRVDSPIGPAGRFTGTLPSHGYVVEGFGVLDGSRFLVVMAIVPTGDADIGVRSVERAAASLHLT